MIKKILAVIGIAAVVLSCFAVPAFADSSRLGSTYYAWNAPVALRWFNLNESPIQLVSASNPFVYTLPDDSVGTFRDRIFTYASDGSSINAEINYTPHYSDSGEVTVSSTFQGSTMKNVFGPLSRDRSFISFYYRDFYIPVERVGLPMIYFRMPGDWEYYTAYYEGNDTNRYSVFQVLFTFRRYYVDSTGVIQRGDLESGHIYLRGSYDVNSDLTSVALDFSSRDVLEVLLGEYNETLIADMYVDIVPVMPEAVPNDTLYPESFTFTHLYHTLPLNNFYSFYGKYDEVSDDDKDFVGWAFTAIESVFLYPLFYVGSVAVTPVSILSLCFGLCIFIWFIKLFSGG